MRAYTIRVQHRFCEASGFGGAGLNGVRVLRVSGSRVVVELVLLGLRAMELGVVSSGLKLQGLGYGLMYSQCRRNWQVSHMFLQEQFMLR